jgi:hypothetical protein
VTLAGLHRRRQRLSEILIEMEALANEFYKTAEGLDFSGKRHPINPIDEALSEAHELAGFEYDEDEGIYLTPSQAAARAHAALVRRAEQAPRGVLS